MFRESSSNEGKKKMVENLDAKTFENRLREDEKGILIDVRTPMEHQLARIPDSKLIDIASPFFITELDKLDRSGNYYLYCRSGNRSYFAGMQMLKMGFENVCHLQPGIIGWKGKTEQ